MDTHTTIKNLERLAAEARLAASEAGTREAWEILEHLVEALRHVRTARVIWESRNPYNAPPMRSRREVV
jgi:hypothetical protein